MINNEARLIGRIGHTVEVKKTQSGISVTNFSLAVDCGKGKDGEKLTTWIYVKGFGKTADSLGSYAHKGDLIAITGRIDSRSYEDRNGQKKTVTEVIIDEWRNLSPKKEEKAAAPAEIPQYAYEDLVGDDELPW